MDKKSIREQVIKLKKEMCDNEISEKSRMILHSLTASDEYKSCASVYTYVSYNQEVETKKFIEQALRDGKNVYVPKIHTDLDITQKIMLFHRIMSLDELVPGIMGIPEPDNADIDETREGLLILPGLAFDKEHNRIGYGGGFYDRYLSIPNHHIKIALCFEFQMFDSIETEKHDIKADKIITEMNVY